MEGSKIRLSPAEERLVQNAEIILTKNSVLKKTVDLLAGVQHALLAEPLPPSIAEVNGKISRGENYNGLPYVVLDYPRLSAGPDLFFIRSFFWWGNFFSSTLQLSGSYKSNAIEKLTTAHALLADGNYFVGINQHVWEHHFEPENYRAINCVSRYEFEEILTAQAHIKIAVRWPLHQWNETANMFIKEWKFLIGLVA